MLSFSVNTPLITFNKETCNLVISGNSFGPEVTELFKTLTAGLDNKCCRNLKIDIDLNFYDVRTIVSLKNLFLFSKSNFSSVEVDWNTNGDFDDIDVLEKICKIKINRLHGEEVH